jgi:hypothetical protein
MEAHTVRPRQTILAALLLAYGSLLALIVVGALRTGEDEIAWLGVALALLFLPVIDFYRQCVTIERDGLTRRSLLSMRRIAYADVFGYGVRRTWAYQSGEWRWLTILARDRSRIDVPVSVAARGDVDHLLEVLRWRAPQARQIVPPPLRLPRKALVVPLFGIASISVALMMLGVALPRTLGGQRLFHEAAALGVVAGLALGTLAARSILREAPVIVIVTTSLAMMVVVPAAALFANMVIRAPLRTAGMTVIKRVTSSNRSGGLLYRADLVIDGVRARIQPSRELWNRLGEGRTFAACVRDGVLGYTVVASYDEACIGENASEAAHRAESPGQPR